jgi:hypothetical protein
VSLQVPLQALVTPQLQAQLQPMIQEQSLVKRRPQRLTLLMILVPTAPLS